MAITVNVAEDSCIAKSCNEVEVPFASVSRSGPEHRPLACTRIYLCPSRSMSERRREQQLALFCIFLHVLINYTSGGIQVERRGRRN